MSHSPLLELSQPPAELAADVETAFAAARKFITEYDPELVVVFGPDHYNGFFYELMPQFCIGLAATSIGDFGSTPGPLDVPRDIAEGLGAGRPGLRGRPGGVAADGGRPRHGATPGDPLRRADRGAGGAVLHQLRRPAVHPGATGSGPSVRPSGRYLSGLDKRVLLIGSGGLSHEPPVPTLETAPAHVVEGLIAGRHPTAEATAKRRANVIDAAKRFAAGEGNLKALNPDWDNTFLDQLAANDLDAIDQYTNDSIKEQGGQSGQEIRNWIAAYAALSTVGPYDITYRYYRPIPEFIAGFSVTTALPRTTA